MKSSKPDTVRVLDGTPAAYNVTIGHGILEHLPSELKRLAPSATTFAVVTDDTVFKLHWPKLRAAFNLNGFHICDGEMPDQRAEERSTRVIVSSIGAGGEQNKTREAKAKVEDSLLAAKCHRDCVVVALGGGIVGDLAGFVAATFMRGIGFVQVPTTLLAIVDASVGGKTAVNSPAGKNLIGAFHQPLAVWADLALLETLPSRHIANGLAESVKMAVCLDSDFFVELENAVESGDLLRRDSSLLQRVAVRSVELKAQVVQQDEKEKGLRAVLNWGHTIGHGIESLLEPALLHGECVSIGCVKEGQVSVQLGHCEPVVVDRVRAVLSKLGLPTAMPTQSLVTALNADTHSNPSPLPLPLEVAAILDKMAIDKKNVGGVIKCVLLKAIGEVELDPVARPVPRAVFAGCLAK